MTRNNKDVSSEELQITRGNVEPCGCTKYYMCPQHTYPNNTMKYKIGDILKIKKGCEGECGNYEYEDSLQSKASFIKITDCSTRIYYYDILNGRKEKIGECSGCFKDEHLEIFIKDFSTIDIGDVVVDKDGDEYRVIGRVGEVIFLENKGGVARFGSEKELKRFEYTIKQEPQEAEMTQEEIEKALGKKIKIVAK